MKTSESVTKITEALLKASAKIKHAQNDATGAFNNSYSSLESCINASKEVLLEFNILVIQTVGGKQLTTRLQHSSGEFYEDTMDLVLSKQDMQGMGSAITYARRQSLTAFLNMAQADDDGNTASGKKPRVIKPAEKKPVIKPDNLGF